jgi:hypothetical protein
MKYPKKYGKELSAKKKKEFDYWYNQFKWVIKNTPLKPSIIAYNCACMVVWDNRKPQKSKYPLKNIQSCRDLT